VSLSSIFSKIGPEMAEISKFILGLLLVVISWAATIPVHGLAGTISAKYEIQQN